MMRFWFFYLHILREIDSVSYNFLLFYTLTSWEVHGFKYLFASVYTLVISFISYLATNVFVLIALLFYVDYSVCF